MCGIAGFAGDFVPGLAARMGAIQKHRGPDGDGIFEDPKAGIALSHVRLSILDLSSAASQPMRSSDGRYVIIFNGEIYNFRELRSELAARGCVFHSTGDTEVLLHGLAEFGSHFLTLLNGIFAFALWDTQQRELLLARDQVGVKPLYYAELPSGKLLFASEIKALCAHPGLAREPNFAAIQQHLAYSYASGSHTALKGVMRLPAGCMLRWRASNSRPVIERYWTLPFDRPQPHSRERALRLLQSGLEAAVSRQLVSDVPIGGMLSGGIDSSVIVALATECIGTQFECFITAWSDVDNVLDRANSDLPHARQVARRLGLHLTEIVLNPELSEVLPHMIWHLDEPIVDPAILASYSICKEASAQGIRVLLSGQGADELFCGYPRYLVMHATRWIDALPITLRSVVAKLAHEIPGAMEGPVGAMLRRIRKAASGFDLSFADRFLDMCTTTPGNEVANIFSPAVREALSSESYKDNCLQLMQGSGLQGLQTLQARDLTVYLPNHNLLYTDKIGMASGVEVRVPLLDLQIIKQVLRYPYDWQLAGLRTKSLFRDAAAPFVPRRIRRRAKAGFGAPYRKWLRYELNDLWQDLASERTIESRGWFDYAAVQNARKRSQAGSSDLYMLQWALITMELWARQFLDHNPGNVVSHKLG